MDSILKTLLTNKNAPQSIFSESVVLGGLLLNLELISSLSIKLPKEAFFYSVYQCRSVLLHLQDGWFLLF